MGGGGGTSQSIEESQQTQPTYDAESGNRTQATPVGGKCSRYVRYVLLLFSLGELC